MTGASLLAQRYATAAMLFIGSELVGQCAAVVMSLAQSAKLNGVEP